MPSTDSIPELVLLADTELKAWRAAVAAGNDTAAAQHFARWPRDRPGACPRDPEHAEHGDTGADRHDHGTTGTTTTAPPATTTAP